MLVMEASVCGWGREYTGNICTFFSVSLDRLSNILGTLVSGFVSCLFFKVFCLFKVVVQSISHLFVTTRIAPCQVSLSFTISQVRSNSCPLSHWCHPTNSSSVIPSPPAFNLSQYRSLFQRVVSWHHVAKALELQHRSFQWVFRIDFP